MFDEVLVLVKAANQKLYDEFRALYKKSARIYAAVNIVPISSSETCSGSSYGAAPSLSLE